MSVAPPWVEPVAAYLAERLPWAGDRGGWQDMAMSAYQFGCDALVALGYAARTDWGAVKRDVPQVPEVWPRWDDVCVTVLALGAQQGELSYRDEDGQPAQRNTNQFVSVGPDGRFKLKAPNIRASFGCGPTYVADEFRVVLQKLGLVDGNTWRAEAEYVFWRLQPRAWALDAVGEVRFTDALNTCRNTLPDDVEQQMSALVEVRSEDIVAARARHEVAIAKMSEWLRAGVVNRSMTDAQHRNSIMFRRSNDLDWLFFRQWRLQGGWLDADGQKAALGIFHDRLAQHMRRALVHTLFPNSHMALEGNR